MATKKTTAPKKPAAKKPAPTDQHHHNLATLLAVLKGGITVAAALAPIVSKPFADAEDQAKVEAGSAVAAAALAQITAK